MTNTPHLGMPLIAADQSQKHVTHNEALRLLDAIVQLSVIDSSHTQPPISASEGDRYCVASEAIGLWEDWDLNIAIYADGSWVKLVPQPGWICYDNATSELSVWNGMAWLGVEAGGGGGLTPEELAEGAAAIVGINTTADSTNRLATKSDGILFSHDDVTPGTGDVVVVINKAATAADAMLALQTAFSTRAMIGLLGDNTLAIRVSADGTVFRTAVTIDPATGHVGFGGFTADANNAMGAKGTAFLFDALEDDCRFTFNKVSSADDVALTFQTGYSARALFGLLGDDNFTIKVTPDGVAYKTALVIDRTTGLPNFERSPKFSAYMNFDKYIAANAFTKVQFNNGRHNDQSCFDATNNTFVAPAAGYYFLGFRVLFKANATVPATVYAAMFKNNVELQDDTRVQTSGTVITNKSGLQSNAVLKLAAGDVIDVRAYMETNDGYISAVQNSFYGHRIG